MCEEIGYFWEISLAIRANQVERQKLFQRKKNRSLSTPEFINLFGWFIYLPLEPFHIFPLFMGSKAFSDNLAM